MRYLARLLLLTLIPACALAQITAKDFFNAPAVSAIALSPDGRRLALITGEDNEQAIVLRPLFDGADNPLLSLTDIVAGEGALKSLSWIDNNTIAAQLTEIREGVAWLADTRSARKLLVLQLQENSNNLKAVLSVRTPGWLVDPLETTDNIFLYAKSGIRSSVYRVDANKLAPTQQKLGKLDRLDGGQFVDTNKVANLEGYVTRWFFDRSQEAVAALHFDDEARLTLSSLDSAGNTEVLAAWDKEALIDNQPEESRGPANIIPLSLAGDRSHFFGIKEAKEDKGKIYKVNYTEGTAELVYDAGADPIVDVVLDRVNRQMVGVLVLRNGRYHTHYFDPEGGSSGIGDVKSGDWHLEAVVDKSVDRRVTMIYREAPDQPGRFYAHRQGETDTSPIASLYPTLDEQLSSSQIHGVVEVETESIHYFLNMPAHQGGKSYPLLVIPHGGPIGVFDTGYYDPIAQYFVHQGYATLRVNYRGSAGYGDEFLNAGKGQWHKLILSDIKAATLAATALPHIDQDRVCIMGISYGGYAAASLLINEPDIYRCGITIAGVSDINLYLAKADRGSASRDWLAEFVGDPAVDYDELKRGSPLYHVQDLARPIMVVHGAMDDTVDVEHSWRLKLMLQKYQADFAWKIYPEEGHNFTGEGVFADLMELSRQFIVDNM